MKHLLALVVILCACGGRDTTLTDCTLGAQGTTCAGPADCCSNDCTSNTCGATGSCIANGLACTGDVDCCSGACIGGACTPTNCQGPGADCTGPAGCCSGRCEGGQCLEANGCLAPDVACTPGAANDCCSGRCEPVQGMAGVTRCTSICRGTGAACDKATDCCDLNCNGGTCNGEICRVQSDACASNAQCCSNICTGGECQLDPANTTCRGIGETCNSGPQMGCCSMVCDESKDPPRCDFATGVCGGQNATCTSNADCCHGICDPSGVCTTPCTPTSGTCVNDGDCCSNTCTNGACAPPSDCQPIGGACTADAQCCTSLCLAGFCDQIIL